MTNRKRSSGPGRSSPGRNRRGGSSAAARDPAEEQEPVRQPEREIVPLEGYLPPDGAEYPQVLRGPSFRPLYSVGGAFFALSLYLLITGVVSQLVIGIGWAASGRAESFQAYLARAVRFEVPTGMLAANLGIATLIPICWVLMTVVHRVRPRWLSSVTPGIRWRYLIICLGVAAVSLLGLQGVSILIGPKLTWAAQPGFLGFLVVIVLTSPLQAIAEEVFFRGYLMQALGSLVSQPWFGVAFSALVFAFLHGTQNLPLFLNRLAFGLLAGLLVLRTGGLEAGIAAHVINNVAAYVLAGLTSSIAALKAVQQVGWAEAAFQVLGFAVFAALAYLVARKMNLRRVVDLSQPH